MEKPLVTVAIPLYQSNEWFDIICDNIDGQDYENIEFIISDRHCLDNTIEKLMLRYNESNFRFIKKTDQVNWVVHCNDLLRLANGKYFMWMPHDDSFSSNYVSCLVELMENDTNSIVALGDIKIQNKVLGIGKLSYANQNWAGVNYSLLFRLLYVCISKNNFWVLFRGLQKTQFVIGSNLFLPDMSISAAADIFWGLNLSLSGKVSYSNNCYTIKRIHYKSATAQNKEEYYQGRLGRVRIFIMYKNTFLKHLFRIDHIAICYLTLVMNLIVKITWDYLRTSVKILYQALHLSLGGLLLNYKSNRS